MFNSGVPFNGLRPFNSLPSLAEAGGGSTPETRRGPWRGAVAALRHWSGSSEPKTTAPRRSRTWRLR